MISESLLNFCDAVQATAASQFIQDIKWIVPLVQTVHILAIAAVLGSALMIQLRCLGLSQIDQAMARVAKRHAPVIGWGVSVLLLSGAVLIVGEPARALANDYFQLKMLLLLGVIGVSWVQMRPMQTQPEYWHQHPGVLRSLSVLSLGLWAGIVFAGRWIAYL
jgi:hypothetical protein